VCNKRNQLGELNYSLTHSQTCFLVNLSFVFSHPWQMLSARLTVLTDQLHSLAPNLDGTAVTSQFNLRVWSRALQFDTPDRRSYVLNGLRYGFDICHSGILPSHECPNLKTTLGEKIAITEWVISGVQKGYIIGPLCHRPSGRFHVSPLGAVPKKNGKIRPIHHLSAPRGDVSINSQLSPEVSTVCYSRLLHLIRRANKPEMATPGKPSD
jgi:hypothetical protein